jgi:hypothetical protein
MQHSTAALHLNRQRNEQRLFDCGPNDDCHMRHHIVNSWLFVLPNNEKVTILLSLLKSRIE